ncbi:MAG: GntR family transcriptional regulator, partial [Pandoraea sp.]|nr:GntR family transcriptional regulator [Pandoraea sp.]
ELMQVHMQVARTYIKRMNGKLRGRLILDSDIVDMQQRVRSQLATNAPRAPAGEGKRVAKPATKPVVKPAEKPTTKAVGKPSAKPKTPGTKAEAATKTAPARKRRTGSS